LTRQRLFGALPALVSGLLTIPAASLVWRGSLRWIPPLAHGEILGLAFLPLLALGLLVFLGMWCGLLTHSWWAVVTTPLGYGIGWGIGFAIFSLTGVGGPSASMGLDGWLRQVGSIFLTFMLLPLLLGAALGVLMAARRPQSRSRGSFGAASTS
jgi:hypothetical protein